MNETAETVEQQGTATGKVAPGMTYVENFKKRGTRKAQTPTGFAKISVAEAARRMGVCESTVRNMANSGKIKWAWGNGNKRPHGIIWQSVVDYVEGRNAQKATSK